MYEFLFINTWPWWLGGIGIGSFVFIFFYFTGNGLGVSTGFVNYSKIIFPTKRFPFFKDKTFNWRFFFCTGIIFGALLSSVISGKAAFTFNVGFEMLEKSNLASFKYLILLSGGFLIGFGARMADGCTSGHSILGIAQFAKSSIIATISFMITAVIFIRILY